MPNYFDFHFHPLNKRFLTEFDDEVRRNRSCTEPIRLTWAGRILNGTMGHILNSQGCVSQAVKGGVSLGIAAIAATEHAFATKKGVLKLLELRVRGQNVIGPIDFRLLEFIRESKGSYGDLMDKEIGFYQWVSMQTDLNHSLHLLSRKDRQSLELQTGKLNLMLAIEGGHSISRSPIHTCSTVDDPVATVQKFRNDPSLDFFYITLTHLTHTPEMQLCSHAFGFKVVENLLETRPLIKGLTKLGQQVVRASVDVKENKFAILIDIKHMSLQGRRDLYNFRQHLLTHRPDGFVPPHDTNGQPWWPIIATHMGVSGISSSQLASRIREPGIEEGSTNMRVQILRTKAAELSGNNIYRKLYFNPTSISLFDDDIEEIVRSRGIIGISLDARILGFKYRYGPRPRDYDYFSQEDFKLLFPNYNKKRTVLKPAREEPDIPTWMHKKLLAIRRRPELYLFCLNLLHMVAVINKMPEKERHKKSGWDYMCLGSDYDGLIDSIGSAHTAENLPNFEEKLEEFLPHAEAAYIQLRPGTTPLLPEGGSSSAVKGVLRKLFYENGNRFVHEWWGIGTNRHQVL